MRVGIGRGEGGGAYNGKMVRLAADRKGLREEICEQWALIIFLLCGRVALRRTSVTKRKAAPFSDWQQI